MKVLLPYIDRGLGIVDLRFEGISKFTVEYKKDGDQREYFIFNEKYYYLDNQENWVNL